MNPEKEQTPGNCCQAIPLEAAEKMKREGWATIEEQKAYWKNKLKNEEPVVQIMDALEEYFGDMVKAGEKLKAKMTEFALSMAAK